MKTTVHVYTTEIDHDSVYVTYEPRWSKFRPPFRWYTRWAYKITMISYNKNGRVYPTSSIKQVAKGGKGSVQTQIGIVNNYHGEKDHPNSKGD